jgi:hypothetical protein
LPHHFGCQARGCADEREVNLVGRVLQPRIAVEIENLLFFRIDRDDLALVLVGEQGLDCAAR